MADTISTLECPDIRPGRGVGNSTRQADFAIQQLFEGKIVFVEDHCYKTVPDLRGMRNTKRHSKDLLHKIVDRLRREYIYQVADVDESGAEMFILYPITQREIYTLDKRKKL